MDDFPELLRLLGGVGALILILAVGAVIIALI